MSDTDTNTPAPETRSAGARRWLGAKDLIADGVDEGSRLVERSQRSFARRIFSALHVMAGQRDVITPLERAVQLGFSASHLQVRWASKITRLALDAVVDVVDGRPGADGAGAEAPWQADRPPIPLRSDAVGSHAWLWDGFLGVVNGVIGDHLAASGNPLAIEMRLRFRDAYLTPAEIGARLRVDTAQRGADATSAALDGGLRMAVFVHGLTATEWAWALDAAQQYGAADTTYATQLHQTLGYEPVFVRYNSGLHISQNGQQLSALLDEVVHACAPTELVLIAHSMGGLVVHSATHAALAQGSAGWPACVTHFITMGTPHEGAPLEKLGQLAEEVLSAIDLPGTQIPAGVISARSAGIKDLRHGYVVEDDWRAAERGEPHARTPLHRLPGVVYRRIVGTLTSDPTHPVGQWVGDAMVRPSSAAAATLLGDDPAEVVRLGGVSHAALSNHAQVYALLRAWLTPG